MTPQPQGPREAIEAIWDKVREAADGFHNSQQWGEEGHWGPDVSYWKQIRAAVDAAKALALLPGDTKDPAPLTWTKEKPTEGGQHYHFREQGGKGRTVVFLSDDGEERVRFFNGRVEYLGNLRGEFAGPIPAPDPTPLPEGKP